MTGSRASDWSIAGMSRHKAMYDRIRVCGVEEAESNRVSRCKVD